MTEVQIRPKNFLILYHANCIDGFTSAWAAHYGLTTARMVDPKNIRLMEADYSKELDIVNIVKSWKIDHLYVVDFSLSKGELLDLYEDTEVHLTMLDHHASAIRKLEDVQGATPSFEYILDTANCGAGLVWKHFFPETEDPVLIRLVRDYDLWVKAYPETDYINKYLKVQPKTIKTWTQLHYDMQEERLYRSMVRGGHLIQKYHDMLVADVSKCARPISIHYQQGLTVEAPYAIASDLGHILAQRSGTFAAITVHDAEGHVNYSLRSEGDYNVSIMAEYFGGGGHKNAAGFSLSTDSVFLFNGEIKHG